jgi:hypothetical protein
MLNLRSKTAIDRTVRRSPRNETMNTWSANPLGQALSMDTQSPLATNPLFEQEKHQTFDAVEAYFECITTCSLDDGECITTCTETLRENS